MKRIIVVFAVLFTAFISSASAVDAAFLRFSPTSGSAAVGGLQQVDIIVDSDSEEILSTDVYVLFDQATLEVQSVDYGSYFPALQHNIEPGKLSIHAHVVDTATSRTGAGTLATVGFKAKAPGTAIISFFCDLSASNTSKIVKNDLNATNIIICTQNNQSTITVLSPSPTSATSSGATATPSSSSGTSGSTSGSASSGSQGGPGDGGSASIGTNGSTGTGGTSGTGGGANVTELPKSGSLDNLNSMAIVGTVLFIVGGVIALAL